MWTWLLLGYQVFCKWCALSEYVCKGTRCWGLKYWLKWLGLFWKGELSLSFEAKARRLLMQRKIKIANCISKTWKSALSTLQYSTKNSLKLAINEIHLSKIRKFSFPSLNPLGKRHFCRRKRQSINLERRNFLPKIMTAGNSSHNGNSLSHSTSGREIPTTTCCYHRNLCNSSYLVPATTVSHEQTSK